MKKPAISSFQLTTFRRDFVSKPKTLPEIDRVIFFALVKNISSFRRSGGCTQSKIWSQRFSFDFGFQSDTLVLTFSFCFISFPLASHTGVFRGTRVSYPGVWNTSSPKNAWVEGYLPFSRYPKKDHVFMQYHLFYKFFKKIQTVLISHELRFPFPLPVLEQRH